MLSRRKYNHIAACTLADLYVRHTGPTEFVFRLPGPNPTTGRHSHKTLKRWVTALLLSLPDIEIGDVMTAKTPIRLRKDLPFRYSVHWTLLKDGTIEGQKQWLGAHATKVYVKQGNYGLHWYFISSIPALKSTLQQPAWQINAFLRKAGILFAAHPQLHRFPWRAPEGTATHRLSKAIERHVFKLTKRVLANPLQQYVDRLERKASQNTWQWASLRQKPAQFWDHSNGLTPFQV